MLLDSSNEFIFHIVVMVVVLYNTQGQIYTSEEKSLNTVIDKCLEGVGVVKKGYDFRRQT